MALFICHWGAHFLSTICYIFILPKTDVQKEIIKMVTEITNETNKNSKIEKVNLILSIISNTASISPAFFSFIKTLLEKLW